MATAVHDLRHHKIGPGESTVGTDPEDEKRLGLFATRAAAEVAIAGLLPMQGFRDWPGGFRILEVVLDRTGWTGGFVRTPEGAGE